MSILKKTAIGREKTEALIRDPVLFVKAFDREPWDYQADILRQVTERNDAGKFVKRIAVVSLPRQNGKSSLSAWVGLWALYCLDNQEILSIANDTDQASIIFRDAKRIIVRSGILYGLIDRITQSTIELKNGNRWLVKSSDSVSSRGLRPSIICYDELGFAASPDLFQVLSAGQAARANPLTVVTSTVCGIQSGPLWNLFELARAGDPAVRLIYHRKNLSPLITSQFLEQQRAILPGPIFAREHENRWGSGSEAFSTLADWERAKGDESPLRSHNEKPAVSFLDLGWVSDESVLSVGILEDGIVKIIAMEHWQGSQDRPVSFASIEARILELKERLNVKRLVIEAPQGVSLAQRLDAAGLATTTQHPTAKSQRELWGTFYTALKAGKVHLPDDAKLRRQLLTLSIKSTATGWRVVDDPGLHQDRALACAGVVGMCQEKPEPFGIVINDIPGDVYKTNRDDRKRRERLNQIPRNYIIT